MTASRNSRIWKLYWKLNEIPVWLFAVIVITLNFLSSIGLSLLPIEPPDKSIQEEFPLYYDIIMSCVFAPIVETIAFQLLPLEICQYAFREVLKKRFMGLSIVLSALIFACVHCFNLTYMISAFITGIILATAYIIKRQNGIKTAIVSLWAIHCTWNIIVSLVEIINL